ncbi:hypothetical protein CGZ96_20260 [Enemella evansiae]|nr:hypothetical protein CGZ96_20260 [Enemella evansiae]
MGGIGPILARGWKLLPVLALTGLAGWFASGPAASQDPASSWVSSASDLRVYYAAAGVLLSSGNIYAPVPDVFPYIYPPFAALAFVPLRLFAWPTATVIWAVINSWLVVAVLHRLGLQPRWLLGLVSAMTVLWLPPVQTTLQLGQVGVLLLFLVVFDLVEPANGERLLPRGVLIGIAVGIKLTPAAFVIYLLLTRERRAAINAGCTFAMTVLVGLLITPSVALGYWVRLAGGDSGADPVAEGLLGNHSISSSVQRAIGVDAGRLPGLALGAVLLGLGLLAAWLAHRAGQPLIGLTVLGLTSAFANPITWLHHLVWVLPGVVVLLQRTQPPLLRSGMLICLAWLAIEPQLRLGGVPEDRYSTRDLWFAASPGIVALAATLLVIAWASVTLWLAGADDETAPATPPVPVREPVGQVTDGDEPTVALGPLDRPTPVQPAPARKEPAA